MKADGQWIKYMMLIATGAMFVLLIHMGTFEAELAVYTYILWVSLRIIVNPNFKHQEF